MVLLVPGLLVAQTIHRSRPIDSVTMRDGRMIVAATSDSIVLVTIRSDDREIDAVPYLTDVLAFVDSASSILSEVPTRAPREEVSYSASLGALLLTRAISDRGDAVRVSGLDLDRAVAVSPNRPEAAKLLDVLRTAARVTAQMTATAHVQAPSQPAAPMIADAARPDSADPTYFEYQTDRPASALSGNAQPLYPSSLRARNVEGEVLAQFVVDADGRADMSTFRILESAHVLFSSAVKVVLPRWRFSPAEIDGRRVRQLVELSFAFPADDTAYPPMHEP